MQYHSFYICSKVLFSESGQNKKPRIPDSTISIEATMWLSNHTPTDPPSIETINITNNMIVLEEVGNIYEAIKFAEELAGDAKTKRIQRRVYLQISTLIE